VRLARYVPTPANHWSDLVDHPLIIPNYHVILIHAPLALLAIGTLIELFAFLWPRSTFRQAGRWMLLIGALSAIPAATSGLFAARQALSDEEETSWALLQHSQKFQSDQQWEVLRDHVMLNAIAVGVFAFLVVAWLGSTDRVRRRLHLVFLIILLTGMGLLTAGAWHGGELVYRYSTGAISSPASQPSTSPTTAEQAHTHGITGKTIREKVENVLPPIQAHVIMAGWVVAMALAALGLSIRQISMAPSPRGDEAEVDQQLADALAPGRALASDPSFNVEKARASLLGEVEPPPVVIPPARFWLIAMLLALITAPIGWWVVDILNVNAAIDYLKHYTRPMAHSILGGSIVVLTIILAIISRWAGRNKAAVLLFALLLLCVLAAQVWVGILLLYDGNQGALTRFGTG
jgi:uncharacterized membrane protein